MTGKLSIMVLLALACTACESAGTWYAPLLPDSVGGWRGGEVRICTRENLFDYMNGAGELYLAYDFRELAVREYVKPDLPKITAEVYRMTTPQDAFGVFSHDLSPASKPDPAVAQMGQDSEYGFGLLRFWKNGIFVRVLADRETPETKAAALDIGRSIAVKISGEGLRPDLLKLLPPKDLVPRSAHYFHKNTVLNYHYYLSDSNILNLSEQTEAVIAQYAIGESRPRLLVVRYPSVSAAKSAFERFTKAYFTKTAGSMHVEKLEDGTFACASLRDRVICMVFEAADEATCRRLVEAVKAPK